METKEAKLERKKILRKRMYYLLIILNILLLGYIVFEIIQAGNLIR